MATNREAPSIASHPQLISAERALKKSRVEPEDCPSLSATKTFVCDTMFTSMVSCHKKWRYAGHSSVACDGVRVDGDDLLSSVFFDTRAKRGCWGPLQGGPSQNTRNQEKNAGDGNQTLWRGYVYDRLIPRKAARHALKAIAPNVPPPRTCRGGTFVDRIIRCFLLLSRVFFARISGTLGTARRRRASSPMKDRQGWQMPLQNF